jgi:hypothetical protein
MGRFRGYAVSGIFDGRTHLHQMRILMIPGLIGDGKAKPPIAAFA